MKSFTKYMKKREREKGEQIVRGIKLRCPAKGCDRKVTVYSKTEYVICTAHGLEMKPEKDFK